MRAPHVTDLDGVDAVVYGIPFDTATSFRTGSRFGPEAIRSASALIRPYNPALAVNVVDALSLARRHGPLALVQLDSHGDTWEQYFGQKFFHGTTFKRAVEEGLIDPGASVQAGMRGSLYGAEDIDVAKDMGFTVLTTDELRDLGAQEYGRLVLDKVGARPVFMSFDIDFLDPAFAPGTGTPEESRCRTT